MRQWRRRHLARSHVRCAPRYHQGVDDQPNTLDGLIRTITAHGDIIAAGMASYPDPRTLPALGEAIYTAARASRGLLDHVLKEMTPGTR